MIDIEWGDESRIDLIKMAIEYTNAKSYLEIGCDKNKVWKHIDCPKKVGVDPVRGGNIRMTSDDFFNQNNDFFDVIFVDGLHYYEQVKRDILNSIKFLNKDGIIIIHDMLPKNENEAIVPIPNPLPKTWVGDVWKVAFDLIKMDDIKFRIAKIDNGCGIITKEKQSPIIMNTENSFDFYKRNYTKLPLVSFKQVKKGWN